MATNITTTALLTANGETTNATIEVVNDGQTTVITADRFVGTFLGNATTATALAVAQRLNFTGDVEGSVLIGTGNAAVDITVRQAQHALTATHTGNAANADIASFAHLANLANFAVYSQHAGKADRAEHADNADHATEADNAATADYASNAGQAQEAVHAMTANTAERADRATKADAAVISSESRHAINADEATHALESDHTLLADEATHATEADHSTESDHATASDTTELAMRAASDKYGHVISTTYATINDYMALLARVQALEGDNPPEPVVPPEPEADPTQTDFKFTGAPLFAGYTDVTLYPYGEYYAGDTILSNVVDAPDSLMFEHSPMFIDAATDNVINLESGYQELDLDFVFFS